MNEYIEQAKQRIFDHIHAGTGAVPYNDWRFEPLVRIIPEHIKDPLGELVPIQRPTAVNAEWSYPSPGAPGGRPTRVRRAVPIDEVLVGWGRVFNPVNNTTTVRVMLAAVTTSPQTTGVVTIPVGPDGPFPPRNRATGEYDVDPAVVLFIRQGLNGVLTPQTTKIAVNQQVNGVKLVEPDQQEPAD